MNRTVRWPSWATLVVLFGTAFGLRVCYLYQIRPIGFFRQPVSDGLVYVQRAEQIANGDWLGPAEFVHAPLYAYFLGLVRIIFGADLWVPRLVQSALGAASCLFVLLAGQRLFDRRSAVLAALLLAIYPPALFFDGLIQKTSLALFLSTLLLWLLACALDRTSAGIRLACGVILGLLVLTQQSALALVPLVLAWLVATQRLTAFRQRLASALAFLVCFALTLAPWAVRNKLVTGALVLTTPNLGQNFAMGNHPDATGTYLPFQRGRASGEFEQEAWVEAAETAVGGALTPREVSAYYLDAALRFVRANPAAWLNLLGKKMLLVWGAYEAYDTEDYYLYREHSWLLRILDTVFHFGVLCPLAVLGLVLTWTGRDKLWLLYGWLILTSVGVATFVVFARYRFPLVPVLVLFAGAGLAAAARRIRAGATGRLAAAVLAATIVVPLVNWPWLHARRPDAISYTNHGAALSAQGRHGEDLCEIGRALQLEPDNVDVHLAAGNTLLLLGRAAEAREHYERAAAGDPRYPGAYRGIGRALIELGRLSEARAQFEIALQLDPNDYRALTGLGSVAARQNRYDEAVALFERALQAQPTYAEAHLNLGNTYLSTGRLEAASACYAAAVRQRPDYADAWYMLGVAAAKDGRVDTARACFERALSINPRHADADTALRAYRE